MKKIFRKLLPLLVGTYLNLLHFFSVKKATKIAFTIFCKPRKGNITKEQLPFLNTADWDFFDCDGVKIQTYHWPGNAKKIVLAHGWESNSSRWQNLITHLQKNQYNILAIDAPAHGNSSGALITIPLYASCLQKINASFKPDIIVGHSVGALTAIYHQYKYQLNATTVKKIIALAPPGEMSRIINDYKNLLKLNPLIIESLDHYFKAHFNYHFEEFSAPVFADKITIEGLIIHDENDEIAPFTEAEAIHEKWDNSILIKTNGLGHSLQDKNIYQEIISFIA